MICLAGWLYTLLARALRRSDQAGTAKDPIGGITCINHLFHRKTSTNTFADIS